MFSNIFASAVYALFALLWLPPITSIWSQQLTNQNYTLAQSSAFIIAFIIAFIDHRISGALFIAAIISYVFSLFGWLPAPL